MVIYVYCYKSKWPLALCSSLVLNCMRVLRMCIQMKSFVHLGIKDMWHTSNDSGTAPKIHNGCEVCGCVACRFHTPKAGPVTICINEHTEREHWLYICFMVSLFSLSVKWPDIKICYISPSVWVYHHVIITILIIKHINIVLNVLLILPRFWYLQVLILWCYLVLIFVSQEASLEMKLLFLLVFYINVYNYNGFYQFRIVGNKKMFCNAFSL